MAERTLAGAETERSRFRVPPRLLASQAFWVTLATLIIVVGMMAISDAFASYKNIFNTTRNFAFIGIMALGQVVVIITGGIDLAVGSVMGLSGIVFGMAMAAGHSLWVSAALGIAVALAAGAVNGYLIAYLGLSPFVVTLGMLSVARSLALVVSNNQMVYQFGPDEKLLFALGGGESFGIANPVWILIALTLIFGFLLNFTVWGRHIYAGGANLLGGEGTAYGALIGSALLEIIRNSLLLAGVDPYWQGTFIGLFIVLAVLLERIRGK